MKVRKYSIVRLIFNASAVLLLAEYRALQKTLEPLVTALSGGTGDAEDKPEMDADALSELYEAIGEFAQAYDLDSIDALLRDAQQHRIPEGEKERFDALVRCVRDSDWDGLQAALSE